jgi:nitroreductase
METKPRRDGPKETTAAYRYNTQEIERLIKTRRSVRLFKKDDVPDELVERLIDLAHWAPSGMNAQPWKFVVIKNRGLLEEIRRATVKGLELTMKVFTKRQPHWRLMKLLVRILKPSMYRIMDPRALQGSRALLEVPHTDVLLKAPVLILVLGNNGSSTALEDCSAATQTLALAAHAHGLGSCWVGFVEKFLPMNRKLCKRLGIGGEWFLATVSALGYPITDYGRKFIERDPAEIVWVR